MDDAAYAQAPMVEAAWARAALGEAERDELLVQKRLPTRGRVAGAIQACLSYPPDAADDLPCF